MNIVSPVPENHVPLPLYRSFPVRDSEGNIIKDKKGKVSAWNRYKIEHYWPYHTIDGRISHYVVRYFNEEKQAKETPAMSYCDQNKWVFKANDGLRILFNLHLVNEYPNAQILLVEGEKCADLATILFIEANQIHNIVPVCWQGGSNAVYKSDWTPLKNRNVILWPDNDKQVDTNGNLIVKEKQPGYSCMMKIAGILNNVQRTKIIDVKEDKPDKWDIADAILIDKFDYNGILSFMKETISCVNIDNLVFAKEDKIIKPNNEPSFHDNNEEVNNAHYTPFKCLGYNNDHRYYLPWREKQVVQLSTKNHSQNALLSLAPLSYWERFYPSKSGIDIKAAVNTMFEMCAKAGIFDISRIRGRGGWSDDGNIVINTGNKLLVDGKTHDMNKFKSNYIYNAALPLEYKSVEPLRVDEAYKFLELCKMFTWENPLHAYLFAGWCVGAPACGALTWRPHTWITGEAGTGKSWIMNKIVKPILGQWALYLKANSTEAFIRQSLRSDALPIMFDEFESEDREASERVKKIIELSRQASYDDGAIIGKGGTDGEAISYMIRSMFMFSSINTMLTKQSDISRITVLSLARNDLISDEQKKTNFVAIKQKASELMTAQYTSRLRARTMAMINVINANWDVFRDVATDVLGTQRAGDQTGALIACAYSLTSDNIISKDKAMQWCKEQDWEETKTSYENTDSVQCLSVILQAIVKDEYLKEEKTISEIIILVKTFNDVKKNKTEMPKKYELSNVNEMETYYHNIIKRFGVKYVTNDYGEFIVISDSCQGVKKSLSTTSFQNSWNRILRRIPGASVKKGERFIDGIKTQATSIPLSFIYEA